MLGDGLAGLGVDNCGGATTGKAAAARDMTVVDVIMGSAAWWLLGFGAVGVDLVGFSSWWLMGFEAVGVDLVGFFFFFFFW